MNRVVEKMTLPNHIGAGPHQTFLGWLLVALQTAIAEIARRLNQTVPKDGSERVQMISYEPVDYAMSSDVNDADLGYYSVVKAALTGANRTLTGIANGAGPEGVSGRVVMLMNASASALTLVLSHENAGSAAANRFLLPVSTISIARYQTMTLWYDIAALRWRIV